MLRMVWFRQAIALTPEPPEIRLSIATSISKEDSPFRTISNPKEQASAQSDSAFIQMKKDQKIMCSAMFSYAQSALAAKLQAGCFEFRFCRSFASLEGL